MIMEARGGGSLPPAVYEELLRSKITGKKTFLRSLKLFAVKTEQHICCFQPIHQDMSQFAVTFQEKKTPQNSSEIFDVIIFATGKKHNILDEKFLNPVIEKAPIQVVNVCGIILEPILFVGIPRAEFCNTFL